MKKDLERLHKLIDEIEIAMMVTRRPDGHLESRAMATQKRAAGADVWFMTIEGMGKIAELEKDPHVNLAYYNSTTREYVSVSGTALVSRDRDKIRELYASDWKIWLPNEGDPRHGTPDDPRIVLIGVDIHAAVYYEVDKPRPVVLYEMAKGWLTGESPDMGKVGRIEGTQGPALT